MLNIATPPKLVTLDFWADLGCPWSYIGSRHLALAVAHEPDSSVRTRWRSFQLHPEAAGAPDAEHAAPAMTVEVRERIRRMGREVGIAFRPASLDRRPDTGLAHRAVLRYDGEPRQRAVVAALYAAHFERGLDISRLDTVADVTARASGEPAAQIRERLAAGDGETELAADLLEARLAGVTAAPTYVVTGSVVTGSVAVEGAQEVEVLRALIAEGRRPGR